MRVLILGATGSLGGYLLRQALDAGHDVSVVVRNPAGLPSLLRRPSVHIADLTNPLPSHIIRGHDVLINCAGNVVDGAKFVHLVEHVIGSIEAMNESERLVCWFLAGAALLDVDNTGWRGVDVPEVSATYWPHLANHERLLRSGLDWRLLCPGPMVHGAALGLDRMRITLDRLPVDTQAFARPLTEPMVLSMLGRSISQMTVPYADAAALILSNAERESYMTRHRVGLALRAHDADVASIRTRSGSDEQ